MAYVDGFVAAVPTANKDAFLKHAREIDALFIKYGATKVVECWGDDVPDGTVTSFPMAVKKTPDETVVFSWVTWPSKAAREVAWKKMMDDPVMQDPTRQMPFDGKRLIYGGFEVVVDL